VFVGAAVLALVFLPVFVGAQVNNQLLFENENTEGVAQVIGSHSSPDYTLTIQIARVIRNIVSLLGVVAVVQVLVGGFEWLMAGGNIGGSSAAKDRVTRAVIGMFIILVVFSIAQFVIVSLS